MGSASVAAGDLNRPVLWRSYVPDSGRVDEYGRPLPKFAEMGKHWARIRPLSGAALVNANQIKPALWAEFTMRIVGDLKALDQLVFAGATWTVEYALNWDQSNTFFSVHAWRETLNPNPSPS